jgi:nucleotide-binding universal stress UspA family protein
VSKIIVGVDSSDRSKDALVLAARLARRTGAALELVCAYPYDDFPSGRSGSHAYRDYLREDAEAALAKVQEGIPDLPPLTMRTVADISPARGIYKIAERDGASLIVIGSSHRGAVGRVLAGTTAERLLHGAPCPVAVAPLGFAAAEPHDIGTIAVGWEGSAESKAALVAATAAAKAFRARLRIVEVLDMSWVGTPALMSGPGFVSNPQELKARAESSLSEMVAGLPADVEAEPVVTVGNPARDLIAQSEDADLVVVGSRAYGPHRAVLLGSVSGALVRKAACPVIVVPRGINAPLEDLFRGAFGAGVAG